MTKTNSIALTVVLIIVALIAGPAEAVTDPTTGLDPGYGSGYTPSVPADKLAPSVPNPDGKPLQPACELDSSLFGTRLPENNEGEIKVGSFRCQV